MHTAETDAPDPALNIPPDDTTEGHRLRTRTIWAVAQYDYLQGDTAEQVCDRYGLAISTFRDRAKREKWRRVDQPEPPLPPVEEDAPADDEPVDCQALSDDALTRVRRALRKGRAAEAASWMRLHEKLENRLEAQRERVRRRERIEQARGSASAPIAIDPMQRMKVLAATARTQIALEQALTGGGLSQASFDEMSAFNRRCAESVGGVFDAAGATDPDSPDSLFSDDGDDGLGAPTKDIGPP